MTIFKTVTIAAMGVTLFAVQALAAMTTPLAPGKPAGTRQAQLETGLVVPMALTAAAVAALVAATSDAGGTSGNPTVTTTAPSGTGH